MHEGLEAILATSDGCVSCMPRHTGVVNYSSKRSLELFISQIVANDLSNRNDACILSSYEVDLLL